MDYNEIDFKKLSDNELLEFWRMLIVDAKKLKSDISAYMDGKRKKRLDSIKDDYSNQKDRIKFIAKYVEKDINKKRSDNLYASFSKSIAAASAYGYLERKGHRPDMKLHSSVEEGYYRLDKYFLRNLENTTLS